MQPLYCLTENRLSLHLIQTSVTYSIGGLRLELNCIIFSSKLLGVGGGGGGGGGGDPKATSLYETLIIINVVNPAVV